MPPPKASEARIKRTFTEAFVRWLPSIMGAAVVALTVMYFDVRDNTRRVTELEKKVEPLATIAANVEKQGEDLKEIKATLAEINAYLREH